MKLKNRKPVVFHVSSNSDLLKTQNSHARIYSMEHMTDDLLHLCHFGWHKCPASYIFGPAKREFFLIHYVASGSGVYAVEGKDYSLSAGDSFLIRPGVETVYAADDNDPWTYYYFAFTGTLGERLLRRTRFSETPVIHLGDDAVIDILRTAMEEIDGCADKYTYGLTVLTHLLNIYVQKNAKKEITEPPDNTVAFRAKEYMDIHYSENISVEDVAMQVSVSRNHLYRLFHAQYGITPGNYLKETRLGFAAKLLECTDLSAETISKNVGFMTYSAFFRLFREKYGVSVSVYRMSHRNTPGKPFFSQKSDSMLGLPDEVTDKE